MIPSSIRIGAHDIKIRQAPKSLLKSAFGDYSADTKVLRLDKRACGPLVVETLLHELCHGIYDNYGLQEGDSEERVVSSLGVALTQIFRDNPWLLQWIQKELGPRET